MAAFANNPLKGLSDFIGSRAGGRDLTASMLSILLEGEAFVRVKGNLRQGTAMGVTEEAIDPIGDLLRCAALGVLCDVRKQALLIGTPLRGLLTEDIPQALRDLYRLGAARLGF